MTARTIKQEYQDAWRSIRQLQSVDEEYFERESDDFDMAYTRHAMTGHGEKPLHSIAPQMLNDRRRLFTGWTNKGRMRKWLDKAFKPLYKITS